MKKLVFALLAVVLLAACKKDPVYVSQHPFSEKQQKAVDTFVGVWAESGSLINDDTLFFGISYDTNVVVLEYSYMNGWVEKFQYQGEVIHRNGYNGDDTCWWFVNSSAERLELWRKSDSVRVWNMKLKIQSETHFSCVNASANTSDPWTTWTQFYKIQ